MPASTFSTAFGPCTIVWRETGLTAFRLPEGEEQLKALGGNITESAVPDWIQTTIEHVRLHFLGKLQDFADVRFDFSTVSPFQESVYRAALTVKAGQTRTYGWLATASGHPVSASRAIGTALGRNPWPLLVPCHRFIGANGKLTGFSAPGGLTTKHRLLSLEGAELALM